MSGVSRPLSSSISDCGCVVVAPLRFDRLSSSAWPQSRGLRLSTSDHAGIPGRLNGKSARGPTESRLGAGRIRPLQMIPPGGIEMNGNPGIDHPEFSSGTDFRSICGGKEFGARGATAECRCDVKATKGLELCQLSDIAPWHRKESGAKLPNYSIFGRNCGC